MKKIISLLLIIMFLCGCEAKYNIKISEDKIDEEILIYEKTSVLDEFDDEDKVLFEDELSYWELDLDYYNKENYNTKEYTGYKYNSYFTHEEYEQLTGLNRCYEEFTYQNEPTIKISTSNNFLCLNEYDELESFTITIETDYKVISSNADKQEGNKQIWNINRKNHTNKPIKLELEKHPAKEKMGAKEIIIIVLFIGLIIINFTVLKKDKKK